MNVSLGDDTSGVADTFRRKASVKRQDSK